MISSPTVGVRSRCRDLTSGGPRVGPHCQTRLPPPSTGLSYRPPTFATTGTRGTIMLGRLLVAAILLAAPFVGGRTQQQGQVQAAAPSAAAMSTGDFIAKGTLGGASAGRNVGTSGWMAG